MSLSIKVKGLDAVIANFDKLANDTQDDVNKALDAYGQAVVQNAKTLISANSSDEGGLLRSVDSTIGSLSVTITARQNYAAYIEFGTRKFAASYISSLPSEWQAYAGTFRGDKTGNTGGFRDFILAIMGWVKRKGIDEKAAYPIALKILRDGIKPKPFLYPSIAKYTPILEKDIEDIFK